MAAKLKLIYFNGRGRAELIRFILHYAKADFEDFRIDRMQDWPALKPNFPYQQIPVLEVTKDGQTYALAQSMTIARHLAKRHNLLGENDIEAARCDEIIDSLQEIHNFGGLCVLREEDPARKQRNMAQLRDKDIPRIFGRLEKQLAANGGEHLVGSGWTWADFHVAIILDGMIKRLGPEVETLTKQQFPKLAALQKRVEAIPEIAAYLAKRPVTEF